MVAGQNRGRSQFSRWTHPLQTLPGEVGVSSMTPLSAVSQTKYVVHFGVCREQGTFLDKGYDLPALHLHTFLPFIPLPPPF